MRWKLEKKINTQKGFWVQCDDNEGGGGFTYFFVISFAKQA
mgnify:CR=1 FL=1